MTDERPTQRIPEIDAETVQTRLQECENHFLKHVDEIDYRNWEWFISRASMNFVAGNDIVTVVDDLFMAARCLHGKHDLHLARHPIEKFLTRRVLPVELGLLSGHPVVVQDMSASYGLQLIMLLARSADDQTFKEGTLLTNYFRRGACVSHQDLAGFGAVVYAGALAAIGRGFDDEAMVGLQSFFEARQPFEDKPAGAAAAHLRRYDGLNTALAMILSGNYDAVPMVCSMLVESYLEDLEKKLGENYAKPTTAQRYIDLGVVAILAVAALRMIPIDLPTEGSIAPYRDFVHVFTTAPTRELEAPELSAEDRKLLREMGMDPTKVEADLKAQAAASMEALADAQKAASKAQGPTTQFAASASESDEKEPNNPAEE